MKRGLFLSMIVASALYAAPQAGDPMIDYKSGQILVWNDEATQDGCTVRMEKYGKDGEYTFKAAYTHGSKVPYAVFDLQKKILYVDNKGKGGKPGPDGFIDEIVTTIDDAHSPAALNPRCKK